jgi:hypothetical protein
MIIFRETKPAQPHMRGGRLFIVLAGFDDVYRQRPTYAEAFASPVLNDECIAKTIVHP